MPELPTIKQSDLKTLVSPLTGCFQSPCFTTTVLNSLYSAGLTAAISGGLLTALETALQDNSPAEGTAALDALLVALSDADGIKNAAAVTARATFTTQSTSGSPIQYFADNWDPKYATNAADGVYKEAVTLAADGFSSLLVRGHISLNFIIDVVIELTPNVLVNCVTECGSNPIPTPTTDCGPDDSSSEECGSRYGYNFPFFPQQCNTVTWSPLK